MLQALIYCFSEKLAGPCKLKVDDGTKSFGLPPWLTWLFQPTRWLQDIAKPQCSLSPWRKLSGHNFQNFDLWGTQNFLRFFLLFVPLGSARGLASGRGSRGRTPLLLAAREGHDSMVQRLLEAKAAVDAQNKDSRGLGGGYWWGKPHEALGFRCEVYEDVDGLSVSWILFITSYVKWASVPRHLH